MSHNTSNRNYVTGGAVAAYRIVKPGSSDGAVVQSSAAGDAHMGISESINADSGERIDVVKSGIADLEFGGVVTRGGPVTADADGKGVAAAPAAGANVRIIGFAEVTTASGDIAPVLIAPGVMQGA